MHSIPSIRAALARHQPQSTEPGRYPDHKHAAVALLLADHGQGLEMLYALRAHHPGDPWSGDIGFPGGHIEPNDASIRAAAERETLEELGLDLATAEWLGRLDDIAGAHLSIVISCFVYLVPTPVALRLSSEVAATFWFPLRQFSEDHRQVHTRVHFGGEDLTRPALNLLGPGQKVLWGITYRLTMQFLGLIGCHLPPTPVP